MVGADGRGAAEPDRRNCGPPAQARRPPPLARAGGPILLRALRERLDALGADDAISILTFLEYVPDRVRAEAAFEQLGQRIRGDLVAVDPATPGYVKTPLEFAPHPESLARRLFDDATIELHLEALAAKQQEDGGWPITWEPPSAAAVTEWRGFMTLKWLGVLDSYGRLR